MTFIEPQVRSKKQFTNEDGMIRLDYLDEVGFFKYDQNIRRGLAEGKVYNKRIVYP